MLNGLLTLLAIVLVSVGGALVWLQSEFTKPGPTTETTSFVVRKGEGTREIAARLEKDGVIQSQHLFIAHYVGGVISTWFGAKPTQLKAGDYQIKAQASLSEVADILSEGRSVLFRATIPEGLTTWQIVQRLKANENLVGEIEQIPLEGTLLPDTYKFARGMTRTQILELMRQEQQEFLDAAWEKRAPDLPISTKQEALILASIVEKETGKADERERVAAVFVNRLRAGMRLQSDPTILYGIFGGQVSWGKPIYRSEIQQKTAHNTYQIDGLPPTPICNPGRAAIEAVLNPAVTKELFFVADGTGGHVFSETLKDHNAAVANWRKIEKEIRSRQADVVSSKAGGANAAGLPVPATASVSAEPATPAEAADVPLPTRNPKR